MDIVTAIANDPNIALSTIGSIPANAVLREMRTRVASALDFIDTQLIGACPTIGDVMNVIDREYGDIGVRTVGVALPEFLRSRGHNLSDRGNKRWPLELDKAREEASRSITLARDLGVTR